MSATKIEVALAALNGLSEDELRMVNEATVRKLKQVRRQKQAEVLAEIVEGDRVRFGTGIAPKYMVGLEATVTGFASSRVRVEVVPEHRLAAKRFGVGEIRVPASVIEKVGV